jgi:hypothetical protein
MAHGGASCENARLGVVHVIAQKTPRAWSQMVTPCYNHENFHGHRAVCRVNVFTLTAV